MPWFDDYNGNLLDKRNLSDRKEYFARGREVWDIRHLNLLTIFVEFRLKLLYDIFEFT